MSLVRVALSVKDAGGAEVFGRDNRVQRNDLMRHVYRLNLVWCAQPAARLEDDVTFEMAIIRHDKVLMFHTEATCPGNMLINWLNGAIEHCQQSTITPTPGWFFPESWDDVDEYPLPATRIMPNLAALEEYEYLDEKWTNKVTGEKLSPSWAVAFGFESADVVADKVAADLATWT